MKVLKSVLEYPSKPIKWLSRCPLIVKIAFIIAVLGVGWFFVSRITARRQRPQYQTVKVERGTIVSAVSASGSVLTTNVVNITTQASGVVKAVYVKDGEKIAAGQKIAEIMLDREGQQKNASAWSAYLSAKNSADSAVVNLYTLQSAMFAANQKFMNDAVARGLATDDPTYIQQNADWLAAEAKYKNQQAVIEQARGALNNAWYSYQSTSPIITAPISGVVGNVEIVPGMVLASGTSSTNQTTSSVQRVAVIQNEANPIVSVNLNGMDVSRVKLGQKVTITLDSLPDKTFTGKVAAVDRIGTVSNNVTSYSCLIQLDTASLEIFPNMAASASIIVETKTDVLLAPTTAIQTQAGQSFVRVLRDGREQQIPVEIGLQGDTQTEIIAGLSEGDEVITATITTQTRQGGSVFSGGGAFRTGGFGGIRIQQR